MRKESLSEGRLQKLHSAGWSEKNVAHEMKDVRWFPFAPGFRWPLRCLGGVLLMASVVAMMRSQAPAALLFAFLPGVAFVGWSFCRLKMRKVDAADILMNRIVSAFLIVLIGGLLLSIAVSWSNR